MEHEKSITEIYGDILHSVKSYQESLERQNEILEEMRDDIAETYDNFILRLEEIADAIRRK